MKNLLFAILLLSGSAIGQKRTDTLIYPNEKVIVETDSSVTVVSQGKRLVYNTFWSNWFVAAAAGANVFFGNEEGLKPLDKRVTPTFEGSFGKWIHPVIGMRGKFGGGLVKSYTTGTLPIVGHGLLTEGPDANGVYTQRWHHLYGEFDILVNLLNAIKGYNPSRFYSPILYLGAGVSVVQHQPRHDGDRTPMGIFGLLNSFRITSHFDANLEIKDALIKQTVDREQSGRDFESYVMLTAGLTYHFGKPSSKMFSVPASSKVVVQRTYTHIPIPAREGVTERDTVIKQETIREVTVEKKLVLTHPMAVFFELNRSTITARDKVNLAFVADIIKSSGGARFKLTGSADSRTASPRYNQQLSRKRCEAVRDYLVKVLLVEPEQLSLDPIGGIDRYGSPTADRTVIIRQE